MNSNAEQRRNLRESIRADVLKKALAKRAAGVPTYSIPEAAALLSISQEYLYRLIQADAFPAVRMQLGGRNGRYVIPAKAVEQLLDDAVEQRTGTTDAAGAATQGRGA